MAKKARTYRRYRAGGKKRGTKGTKGSKGSKGSKGKGTKGSKKSVKTRRRSNKSGSKGAFGFWGLFGNKTSGSSVVKSSRNINIGTLPRKLEGYSFYESDYDYKNQEVRDERDRVQDVINDNPGARDIMPDELPPKLAKSKYNNVRDWLKNRNNKNKLLKMTPSKYDKYINMDASRSKSSGAIIPSVSTAEGTKIKLKIMADIAGISEQRMLDILKGTGV